MDKPTITPEDLEKLQMSNQRRLAEFQAQGVTVNMLKIREMLDGIEPQVARARLMAPGAPNGLSPLRPV